MVFCFCFWLPDPIQVPRDTTCPSMLAGSLACAYLPTEMQAVVVECLGRSYGTLSITETVTSHPGRLA